VSVAAGTWEPSDAEEGDDEPAEAAQPEDPQPHYANLVEFVTDHLSPLVRRRAGGGRTWCGEWWRHPEAVERLTTLWHAWETLRIEGGTAMSNWCVPLRTPNGDRSRLAPATATLTSSSHCPMTRSRRSGDGPGA
jgi:hypothetical protein